MMKLPISKTAGLVLAIFMIQCAPLRADDLHIYDGNRQYDPGAQTTQNLQDSFLKATRLLQKKQELQILSEQPVDIRRVDTQQPKIPYAQDTSSHPSIMSPVFPIQTAVSYAAYQWISDNQAQSPLGLVESYPQDGNINQGFTYDQALAGMTLLSQGDSAGAKKIFDFYNSQWDGTGFWTVYNTQSVNGSKVEFAKIMGPNAWMGLFCLSYYRETGDTNALDLAVNIGHWISSLPHSAGGVAMGADIPGNPNWGQIYSIENNLDYYAFLNLLVTKAPLQTDRDLFKTEFTNLKQWFQATTYDAASGLFKRGPSTNINDMTLSLDTNTWAISAIGIDGLKTLMNFNDQQLSDFVGRIESNFAVQSDGSYGGNVLTAKGFDFAGALNAQLIQNQGISRAGIKWVEGTNQMILVYEQLAVYYQTVVHNDTLAASYKARADYFTGLNSANLTPDGKSYFYTDSPGTRVFWDSPFWNATPGAAVPSTAWVYFSINGFNPFNPYGQKSLPSAEDFRVALSVSSAPSTSDVGLSSADELLNLRVDVDLSASMTLDGKTYQGTINMDTLSVLFSNISGSGPNVTSENWVVGMDETYVFGSPVYWLKSFTKLLNYADSSVYNYTYSFYTDGYLASDLYSYSSGSNSGLTTHDYTYAAIGNHELVNTVASSTYSNDQYVYGSLYKYGYDVTGNLASLTITMETRDNPLLRALQTHEYLFGASGMELLYLGTDFVPVS